jgi:hypothetical protein
MMRRRWLVFAVAALLITPAGAVLAQNDTNETNETDGDGFDANESANASDDEADEDDEEAEDADEADEAEEADDDEAEQARARGSSSGWTEDNGTYTGEFLQVTVDEELPGLREVTYVEHDATVFASVALSGEAFTHHANQHVLSGETDANEFAAIDDDGGHLTLEGDDGNATLEIAVADGVDVNASDRYSDDDSSAYQLHLGSETFWVYGEDLAHDNGTFAVDDDARLSQTFPAEEAEAERAEEDEHEREDRREAGSQWDRSNDTFEGDHVSFTLDANQTRILDYALTGSATPVFTEADIPEGNESQWRAHGKAFEMRTDEERIRVVDVPPAILEIRADDETEAHLALADGVNATEVEADDDEAVYELHLDGNRTAWVSGEDLTLDNGTFTVGDRAMFRAMPTDPSASANQGPGSMPEAGDERGPPEDRGPPEEAGPEDEAEDEDEEERGPPAHALNNSVRTQVEQAKAAGQVGAEVHVGDNGSQPVAVEMGEVRVTNTWSPAENGSAGMQIQAPDDAPATTVTMNLEKGALGNVSITDAPQKLSVEYDNETIAMADSLDDVLEPTDDEGEPEYLLLVGGEEVQVLVSVPHFSPHQIEVVETQSSQQVDSSQVPGFTAVSLALASGLAAAVAGIRRQR